METLKVYRSNLVGVKHAEKAKVSIFESAKKVITMGVTQKEADAETVELLSKIRATVEEMLAQPQYNLFRIGYYVYKHPDADLSTMPAEKANEIALKFLQEDFMLSFIDMEKVAVQYSFNKSVANKKLAIDSLNETIRYFQAGDITLQKAKDYEVKTPMVFYGSSITQGGCASRPGTCYQAWLSRWFDADYINLGFSGSARGEDEIADYIAGLEMSAFIYDYDYNSPTYDTLVATHDKMLRRIRAAHPDLPIICASRPRFPLNPEETARRDLIHSNVERLRAEGDTMVSFVSGKELIAIGGMEGTVDFCHPTDLGFYSMAVRFAEELEKYGFKRK